MNTNKTHERTNQINPLRTLMSLERVLQAEDFRENICFDWLICVLIE